jgi:hypothetical protein
MKLSRMARLGHRVLLADHVLTRRKETSERRGAGLFVTRCRPQRFFKKSVARAMTPSHDTLSWAPAIR